MSDGFVKGFVIGAVRTHRIKLFVFQNLGEQRWQLRCIANGVVAYFTGPDLQRLRIHTEVRLASLAPMVRTVFFDLPFSLAQYIDSCAVDQKVQITSARACWDNHAQYLLLS